MTTAELHNILDDENKKLSKSELCQVIHELKIDALDEANLMTMSVTQEKRDKIQYYYGEGNAFQICLDLLAHLDTPDSLINNLKEKIIELKLDKIRMSVPEGHCPYAYYYISSREDEDCNNTTCDKCKYKFLKKMEAVIRKEVEAKEYLKE